jgi:hypothetical protein
MADCGERAPNHIPENVRVTTIERWRDYAYRLGISDGEARAQQQAFRHAKDGLLAKDVRCSPCSHTATWVRPWI